MAKTKYYKLGKTAASFYDPVVKLKISGDGVGKLELQPTKRIENAVLHGHLKEVDEKDYKAWISKQENSDKVEESASKQLDITTLKSSELTAYYKSNYKVTAEDVEKFDKMKKDEKIAFLLEDEDEDVEEES